MKNLFIVLLLGFTFLFSCENKDVVVNDSLTSKSIIVLDTVNISVNSFGDILGYDVVVEIDSVNYHTAFIDSNEVITNINNRIVSIPCKD